MILLQVDGSSGDGVVRAKTTVTGTAQLRESQTYAEIDGNACLMT